MVPCLLLTAFLVSLGQKSCVDSTPDDAQHFQDPLELNEEFTYYMTYQSDSQFNASNSMRSGRPGQATNTHSCSNIRAVPSHLRSATHMWPRGLGQFYQKYTEVYGIPVLGSRYLPDAALQRACYVARFLLADRRASRQAYYSHYGRFALMGAREVTTHIPEHADLGLSWNQRARGLGATVHRPVSTAAEENALCYTSDRYRSEDIVLHEFSHGAHLLGATFAIQNFDSRLRALYNSARSRGLWAHTYAMSTDHEYFAEGVQSYFHSNSYANPPDGIHNHVNTRAKLRAYDPALYQLVEEVFPCGNEFILRCDKDRGCTDNNTYCPDWAGRGECTRNPAYMKLNCKLSCNICAGHTVRYSIIKPWDYTNLGHVEGETTRSQPSKTASLWRALDCQDNDPSCARWAQRGECRQNPAYMLLYCKNSCKVC